MEQKVKTMILLFFVCLILIPAFIFGVGTWRTNQLQTELQRAQQEKLLEEEPSRQALSEEETIYSR